MEILRCARCGDPLAIQSERGELLLGSVKIQQKVTLHCRLCTAVMTWFPPWRKRPVDTGAPPC